jgi:vacuolar-type H+-ATPase subunit H
MSKNTDHDKSSHQKADSPLKKIKEKELEFGGKYLEAKKQSEIIISDARKKASEIKSNSNESSIREAETYYKQKLSAMNRDKEKIDDKDVIKVKNVAEKNYSKAYDYLMKQIIPNV